MLRYGAMIGLVLLGGCVTVPSVEYRQVKSPADMTGMSDSFYLRRSALEITSTQNTKKDSKGNETTTINIAIKSAPKEDQRVRYAIGGKRELTASTRINITKIENTDLIGTIGSETTDTTKSTIEQAGGVIAKLISIGAVFGAAGNPPCFNEESGKKVFDLDPSKPTETFDGETDGCIDVVYGPVPSEALPASQLPIGANTRYYYFAACRDATVTVRQTTSKVITETVKISDPNYLQYVQFPVKGKIQHHSSCGVSVLTEASPATNPADIVGALEAQAKAIAAALEAAKKD